MSILDGNVIDATTRKQLKDVCYLFGSQKAVAEAAGVDNSNLGKWLNGKPALSERNIASVLNALGLPNLSPEKNRVLSFFLGSQPVLAKPVSTISLLKLYFPNGGQIAPAPWTPRTVDGSIKQWLVGSRKIRTVTYAITDGGVRAVLRHPIDMFIYEKHIKSHFAWRNGDWKSSLLNISDIQEQWVSGVPSVAEFDAVWNDRETPLTADDLLTAIRDERISYREAVRRILSNRKS